MSSANIMALGPCSGSFATNDLGDLADVTITLAKKVNDIMEPSNYGDNPIDAVDMGISAQAELTVLEADMTILSNLPGFTKVIGTTTTGTYISFGGTAGATAITTGALVITPKDSAKIGYKTELHKAYLASCEPTIVYTPEGIAQGAFTLVFRGMIDTTKNEGDMVGRFGATGAVV